MSGTTYTFAPATGVNPPFSFQPTLDGAPYVVSVRWNVQGQRWYATCADTSGNVIFTRPLISSDPAYPISLTFGLFSSTMVYYAGTGTIVVSP